MELPPDPVKETNVALDADLREALKALDPNRSKGDKPDRRIPPKKKDTPKEKKRRKIAANSRKINRK